MEKNVCVPFCNNLSVPLQIYCCNHYDYDAFLILKYLFELLDLTKMYLNIKTKASIMEFLTYFYYWMHIYSQKVKEIIYIAFLFPFS